MHWSDMIGWFGFAVVLASYSMVALQRWHVRSIPNQIGNIVGASALAFNSLFYDAWVPTVLNLVWMVIAFYTFIQLIVINRQSV